MSMICCLREISEPAIQPLLDNPETILDMLDKVDEDMAEALDESLLEPEIDLDKAWHAIHYLLTGTEWEGDPPLSYILNGGEVVGDVDVGYGPAHVLRPAEVRAFDAALSEISSENMRQRFNPQAMMAAKIYPTIWDRDPEEDDTLGYVLEYYETLKAFVHNVSEKGKGILIYLT